MQRRNLSIPCFLLLEAVSRGQYPAVRDDHAPTQIRPREMSDGDLPWPASGGSGVAADDAPDPGVRPSPSACPRRSDGRGSGWSCGCGGWRLWTSAEQCWKCQIFRYLYFYTKSNDITAYCFNLATSYFLFLLCKLFVCYAFAKFKRQKGGKYIKIIVISLADPGGRTRRAPPLTAADLWFFMPKTLIFLIFFDARFTRDSF